MKNIKLVYLVLTCFLVFAMHRSFAALGNDKTLQVDNFATSIWNIDEDNNLTFEREDSLIKYAVTHGYQNLILKRIDKIEASSNVFLFSKGTINYVSLNQIIENRLANFLYKAHNAGIIRIGAVSPPTNGSNPNNYFFDNINHFNRRQLLLHTPFISGKLYCFDIIYTEVDFWGNDPTSNKKDNWNVYYKPGILHMKAVKDSSNQSGYNPLIVSTYIGNLTKTPGSTPQNIADTIDLCTDWVQIDFYLNGNDMNQISQIDTSLKVFRYDEVRGKRLVLFANNTDTSYILPLFNSQATDSSASNYFGDNLINDNGLCFNPNQNNWKKTVNGVKDYFDSLYSNVQDPYRDHVSLKSMKELCEDSVSTPLVPNKMTAGVSWFKYSTVPDAGYVLQMPADSLSLTQPLYTIRPDEFFLSGKNGCINCNNINTSNSLSGQILKRQWYKNDTLMLNMNADTLQVTVKHLVEDIYTHEITANSSSNTTFNSLKIRKDTKVKGTFPIGNYSYWFVNFINEPTCPNFNNGSISALFNNYNCSLIYKWFDSLGNLISGLTSSTATNLSAGNYTLKVFCGSTLVSEYPFILHQLDAAPHPTIYSNNDDATCYGSIQISSAYSSYSKQWYRNGTGAGNAISGATGLSYTATQNGTYYVKVTQSGGCSGFSAPLVINYSPNATISGSDITCEINKTYSVAEDPNNATYDWTLPGGVSASADGYSTITISNWNSAASTGGTISCTVTNECGNSTTANFTVKGCCDAGTGDLNNATLSTTQTLSGSFSINGTLNITGSGTIVTMNSANVQLNKEATINVGAGAKLIITGSSYLRTCGTDMWTGIVLQSSTSEVQLIGKSKIEDALIAINSIQNGKVVIDDATLNANYIGLKITGTGVANSSYIGSSAIFSCKNSSNVNANCLKAPHSSQRTLQGICLNGIGSISIGDASNSANVISNCETGIYTSTSSVNVIKTDFEACNIGINAQNDAALIVSLSNFDECVTGIDDRYNVDLNVSSCNFNKGTKGIYTSLGNTISIGIHDNNFTDFTAFAIQHISNHRVQYSIYNNIISNTGSEGMNYPGGIEINGLYDNSIDNNSVTDIYLNEFYNLAKGIHLQSIDYAHIFNNLHNELMETGSYDYQTYGIKVENCSSTRIEVNSVSSYGSSQQQIWWSNGIMADNSPYTNLFCNSVGNIGRGLWIGGASPHTTLAGNAMGNCYDQVYLNWNLMGLQDQGASTTTNPPNGLALDNEWIGSPYTAGNGHQTTSYFSNYFKGGGYTTFHTRSGGTYEPTDNYTHDPTNDYQACATNILTNFSADPYCIERPELPTNSEYESRVAQDSIDYDSYFETFKWMGKEYLLSRSKQDANLVANDAAIANAVAQLEQENVGTIGALKDSLANVEVDSATTAVISPLQQINNGLQPTLAVESNYKTATNISMSFAQNKAFTNSQKSTIIYLSNLCPYSAGPAVYMARTLRALFEEIPPRYNSCDNYNPIPQNRKANLNEDGGFVSSYKLFPSPSDGNAVYEFVFDKKASANLKVYDYTGKLILQQDVSGTNSYEFKKLSLSEGVYHVQLFVNGDLGDEQNMVVVK